MLYLSGLTKTGSDNRAAHMARISTETAMAWQRDPAFKARCDKAHALRSNPDNLAPLDLIKQRRAIYDPPEAAALKTSGRLSASEVSQAQSEFTHFLESCQPAPFVPTPAVKRWMDSQLHIHNRRPKSLKIAASSGLLVSGGSAVKALGNGLVGGLLVRFSDEHDTDLAGEFFDGNTDFALDGDEGASFVLYHHGRDREFKTRRLGKNQRAPIAVRREPFVAHGLKFDPGVWIEQQLDERDEYEQAVYELAKRGKLGWSSGTASHLVEREARGRGTWIKSWPLGLDASLTPTPCDHKNVARAIA